MEARFHIRQWPTPSPRIVQPAGTREMLQGYLDGEVRVGVACQFPTACGDPETQKNAMNAKSQNNETVGSF